MAKQVVISLFDNEAAADSAAAALKDSGIAKHDAIGVLVLDESGDLKAHKLGAHSLYKGAGIGFVLALLGPIGVELGGRSEVHAFSDEALEEAAVAAAAPPASA